MIGLQGKSRIMNFDEVIRVERDVKPFYEDGRLQKVEPLKLEFQGNLQPLGGRDLLIVPEGDRHREQYWLFTEFKVMVNDRMVRNEVNFQAQSVEDWGSYTKTRMMRVDVGPKSTP